MGYQIFPFTVRKYWIATQILYIHIAYLSLSFGEATSLALRVFICVHLCSSVVAFFPIPERGSDQ